MKERPILFKSEMVRAILDGWKTQTRRIIKQQSKGYVGDGLECPYGFIGDRLWVREKWCNINKMGVKPEYYYFADMKHAEDYGPIEWKWNSSRYMPRVASRIILDITRIRVERLQDISEEDAKEEGCDNRIEFFKLWNSINAKRGYTWESNPFVWVISFRRKF